MNRTGHPELDRAIKDFKRALGDDAKTLRTFDGARWRCGELTRKFATFIVDEGYNLEPLKPFDLDLPEHPDDLGYEDRTIRGAYDHVANIFCFGRQTFMVDWTAAQYGYTKDFPMIQLREGEGWVRQLPKRRR